MTQPNFEAQPTDIDGLFTVSFKVFEDERGSVMEFYRQSDFENAGLPSLDERPQVNAPLSNKGTIRGIHAEYAHKLVSVASGVVYAVIVDLRRESQTAGAWRGFKLSRGLGLFVSKGLGNSFQSISEEPSVYLYHFEKEWQPGMPGKSCNPLDPTLAIDWPIKENEGMIISDKDRSNPSLKDALAHE
jgi:dTDP-4-dehydrorhamnose 3,5-epimerase